MKINKQPYLNEKAYKKKRLAHIKYGCNAILKGEMEVLKDPEVMKYMPTAVLQMLSKGKEKTAKIIIDRFGNGLISSQKQIRSASSEALFKIIDNLTIKNRIETTHRLLDEITGLAIIEGVSNPAYGKVCSYLNEVAKVYKKNKRFSEYNLILETFQQANNKQVSAKRKTTAAAAAPTPSITTSELLSSALKEFQPDEAKKRERIIPVLSQMGNACVTPLLRKLKESENRSLQEKIIQIISDIGPAAIPDVTQSIHEGQSWFYLRNLARILGKIGDESVSENLTGLLKHKEYSVRREALKSLYIVGGSKRENIFIYLLFTADDRLKTDVVAMLGALKKDDAIPHLLNLLETETFIAPKERIDLGIKICSVLGSIGSEDAILPLRSVLKHKISLTGKKKYNEKVQSAAKNAVEMIQWKVIN